MMRALRWYGPSDLRLQDVREPSVGEHDVLIEVAVCGICGTDLHEYEHGPNMIRKGPHPLTGAQPPITLGHEFSGTVFAVGAGVTDLDLGSLVTVDPCLRCGSCPACLRGNYHLCAIGGSIGLALDGALAEKVVVPRINVLAVPPGVTAEQAAVAEPLAVGLHGARRAGVEVGATVLITGAGPIGIAALLGAKALGAASIYMSELSASRADLARSLGATEVFDPSTTDVRKEVFVRTGRKGPDAAIEATGRPDAFELGLRSLRRGGTMSVVGISASDLTFDMRQLVLFERQIAGSLGYHHDMERVLDLIAAGRLDPAPFTAETAALSEGPAIFERLAGARGEHLKVLLTPKD